MSQKHFAAAGKHFFLRVKSLERVNADSIYEVLELIQVKICQPRKLHPAPKMSLTPEMHSSGSKNKRYSYSPPSPLLLSPRPFRRQRSNDPQGVQSKVVLSNHASAVSPLRGEKEEGRTVEMRVRAEEALPGKNNVHFVQFCKALNASTGTETALVKFLFNVFFFCLIFF